MVMVLVTGIYSGRALRVAQHQGQRRRWADALLVQLGVTLLALLYGLVLLPGQWAWSALMLGACAAGVALGVRLARRLTRELSSAQLRTDAILKR